MSAAKDLEQSLDTVSDGDLAAYVARRRERSLAEDERLEAERRRDEEALRREGMEKVEVLLDAARASIEAAQAVADKYGTEFYFSVGDTSSTYYPKGQGHWSGGGWYNSSSSC